MRLHLLAAALSCAVMLLAPGPVHAQLPQTRLYSLFPPGAKAGASVEVQVTGGEDLEDLSGLQFSHPGITAAPKMQDQNGKPQPVANTFLVTVDAAVPPGLYEARTIGLFGLSNPRTFVVSDREERQDQEPNNEREQAQEVPLGQIVNGRMNSGADVDYFRFTGTQGQRIIAACRATRIDSRMDAAIELQDATGRRLDYGRQEAHNDPLVDVTLPADGTYFIRLHDFIYGGGNEYVYRLSVGTGPHIDFVMPPPVRLGPTVSTPSTAAISPAAARPASASAVTRSRNWKSTSPCRMIPPRSRPRRTSFPHRQDWTP